MLRHNLLLIYRNFKRFKSTFFINLIGLSTGLACTLLIYLWIRDEVSVDKFHEKDSRLYQVMQNYPIGGNVITVESTPSPLAKSLKEDIPEIEESAVSTGGWYGPQGILSVADYRIKATELYVSPNFFNVFSFKLISGDANHVLKDKYSVMLSDELALKLFHTTENIIGKTVQWERNLLTGSFIVTGIFSKPPSFSTAQFDLLFTYDVFHDSVGPQMHFESWENSNPSTFVLLKEGVDANKLNDKIKDFIKAKVEKNNGKGNSGFAGSIFLQKYSDKYLYSNYENGVQSGGRISYVKLFSTIAVFILLIACINFMNLCTAKASRRIKEIGIKKAIGAHRRSLIFQYLLESVFMAIVSLCIAILIVDLALPQFNQITGKNIGLTFDTNLVLSALAITLFTGIIAGSYPALYLSGFHPAAVLKGKLNTSIGEAWTRKGLVVFQFALSVILIVSVLVVYKQISFIQTKNLGYSRDHIIQFSAEGKLSQEFGSFQTEVQRIPGVIIATSCASDVVQNNNATGGVVWEGKKPDQKMEFGNLEIGDGFLETLSMKIIEGRSFNNGSESESSKIIFNETAISAMALTDPIGKTVKLWGQERQIIGVIQDFNFESLYKKIKPCFVLYNPGNIQNVLIKIEPGKENETLPEIEKMYHKFNPGLAFEYKFLDNDYQKLYAAEKRVGILSRYFAAIAIILSCLGLYGLAAFTAERRVKEIGIRKVLGSSVFDIIYLLSTDFTKIVLTSILISLPISFLIVQHWLESFAYKIELQWWFFIGAGIIALLIAWITVGTQAVKAARVNPVKCLRDE